MESWEGKSIGSEMRNDWEVIKECESGASSFDSLNSKCQLFKKHFLLLKICSLLCDDFQFIFVLLCIREGFVHFSNLSETESSYLYSLVTFVWVTMSNILYIGWELIYLFLRTVLFEPS